MRPQLTLRSVDFRAMHPKTCFGGGYVPNAEEWRVAAFAPHDEPANLERRLFLLLSFAAVLVK